MVCISKLSHRLLSGKFYNGQCVGNGCLYGKDNSVILRFNDGRIVVASI